MSRIKIIKLCGKQLHLNQFTKYKRVPMIIIGINLDRFDDLKTDLICFNAVIFNLLIDFSIYAIVKQN